MRNLSKRATTNKLHPWASEKTITINQKNLPTFRMDQVIAFLLMSNKDDPLALDVGDRRYLMVRTEAGAHPDGRRYYDRLHGVNGVGGVLGDAEALGAIYWELLRRDLGGYSIEGPAPFTKAKRETIDASANEWTRWMIEHSGSYPMNSRVVALKDRIQAMPSRLHRSGCDKAIGEALRERFGGISWPHQIQPDGRRGDKIRVWLLGETAKAATGLASGDVLRMYREDRQQRGAVPGDFDFDEVP